MLLGILLGAQGLWPGLGQWGVDSAPWITNGRFRSVPHRVVSALAWASKAVAQAESPRLATPFFLRSHGAAHVPLELLA